MNAAQRVIERFGGANAMSRRTGIPTTTISHWAKTGSIPPGRQSTILKFGEDLDPPLRAIEFITDEVLKADAAAAAAEIR